MEHIWVKRSSTVVQHAESLETQNGDRQIHWVTMDAPERHIELKFRLGIKENGQIVKFRMPIHIALK